MNRLIVNSVMRKWIQLVLLCLAIGLHSVAQAADSGEAAPATPFVRFPKRAAYTVVVILPQKIKPAASGGQEKILVKVDVTKTAEMKRCVSTWSDGSVTENWFVGDLKMVLNGGGNIFAINLKILGNTDSSPRWDASDFAWLAQSNYAGIASFQNTQCYCFQKNRNPKLDQNGVPLKYSANTIAGSPGVALIDMQTYLPVAMNDGIRTFFYRFSETPDHDLQLPSYYESEMTRIHKQTEAPRRISNEP